VKTVLFTFESPVGTFWIHPEPGGRVQLRIDRTRLKTYTSARAAAHDVYARTTGWEPWDSSRGTVAPPSLVKWKRGSGSSDRDRDRRRQSDRSYDDMASQA